jgi:hypothetical protein
MGHLSDQEDRLTASQRGTRDVKLRLCAEVGQSDWHGRICIKHRLVNSEPRSIHPRCYTINMKCTCGRVTEFKLIHQPLRAQAVTTEVERYQIDRKISPESGKQRLELHGQAYVSAHVEAAGHHTCWNSINTCVLMEHQLHKVQSPNTISSRMLLVPDAMPQYARYLRIGHNRLISLRLEIIIRSAT